MILSGLCLLSLAALPFLAFWPVTIGRQIWAIGDLAAYHHPLFVVSAAQWRQGHLPLWNPYLFGGTPLAAAQQGGVFYPLNIVLWLMFPAWRAMGLSILIHLALAGLSVWIFLRSLRLHPLAAWLGGVVFAWGGFTMSHLGHVVILRALPWIGFALHGFHGWLESRRFRYLLEISASVALLCLSGYIPVIIYALLLILTYFWYAAEGPWRLRALAWLALSLGIGLSAPQLLPGIELWISRDFLRPGEGDFNAMTGYSFHPSYLLTLLFPRGRTGTFAEMVGYIGTFPLLLVLLSLFMRQMDRMERLRRFFGSWLLISLLLAMGRYVPPLAAFIFFMPVLGSHGIPSRHLLEFSFSAAILAAIGLDAWMNGVEVQKPTRRQIRLGIVWLVAWICLALVAPYTPEIPPLRLPWVSLKIVWQPVIFLLAGIGLLVILRRVRNPWGRAIGMIVLVGLVLYDLLDFGLPLYQPGLTSPDFYETAPTTVQWLQEHATTFYPYRILSFEATGHVLEKGLGKALLAANYNAAYGVESLIGHDGLMLRQLNEVSKGKIPAWGWVAPEAVEDPAFRALLDQWNVRYLLIKMGRGGILARYYPQKAMVDDVEIYENTSARPRLFALVPVEGPNSNHMDDPRAFIDSSGKIWADPPQGTRYDIVLRRYSGDRVEVDVSFEGNALLIHSTNIVRGWRVWVDGKPMPLIRVNKAFQGVYVPEGNHRVVFAYMPDSVWVGMGIAGMALGGLLAVWTGWRVKAMLFDPTSERAMR